jgi:hypothetical protein
MKGLILYYKTSLKNHVDVDHSIIFKNIEEINSLEKGNLEKQPTKRTFQKGCCRIKMKLTNKAKKSNTHTHKNLAPACSICSK